MRSDGRERLALPGVEKLCRRAQGESRAPTHSAPCRTRVCTASLISSWSGLPELAPAAYVWLGSIEGTQGCSFLSCVPRGWLDS